MVDSGRIDNLEANEDDLAVLMALHEQGYMYEPRIQQSNLHSDDSSDEESIGEDTDYGDSDRVGNTDWYANYSPVKYA